MSDIDENPDQAATEIYYPDSGTGPVQSGLPGQPTARPSGYSNSTADTGVQGGVTPTDIPSGDPGRRTLGDWLHKHTKHNITPLPGEGTNPDASPTIQHLAAEGGFVDQSEVRTVYSQDPNSNLNSIPNPNGFGPGGSANTLLRDVEGEVQEGTYNDPTSGDASQPMLSNILARNRFSPGEPFSHRKRWANPQKFERSGKGKVASTLGTYVKEFDGLATEELTRIAEHLLLNAVGDRESSFGDKGKATLNQGLGKFGRSTQLGGSRKEMNPDDLFRTANAVKPAINDSRAETDSINGAMAAKSDLLAEGERREKGSFGVLNNHLEMFGSALPTSMILLAATAALSMLIATLVIAAILDLLGVIASLARGTGFGGGLNPEATYLINAGEGSSNRDVSSLPMGAAYGNDDFSDTDFFSALYKYMGIPTLDGDYPPGIPFLSATLVGVLEFFIGNSLNGGGRIPQITTNSAGYYVVVVRNAIRDAEQISEAAGEMSGGGFFGAIEGFFSLIDAFRSSATFRFAMVMVQIGDRVVSGQGMVGNRDNGGIYGIPQNLPENTSAPVVVASLHQSVRMKGDKKRLTYSFTALPHVGLRPPETWHRPMANDAGELQLPALTQTYGQKMVKYDVMKRRMLGGDPNLGGIGMFNDEILPSDIITSDSVSYGEGNKKFQNRLSYFVDGKIGTGLRESIEEMLDTYYVPFYFHDLRTNEIIPLPVFVDSISDSFTPKWSEVEGFGRGDPVQIYGGTTRKIGFSFYMVATNEEDYSALYYAINRLVAMVYPQWGEGEKLTNSAGQSFTMPYSSVPAASPLVRIRLGELFASNRAPENVRRLFGANEPHFRPGREGDPEAEILPSSLGDPGLPASLDDVPNKAALEAVLARRNDKTDATVAPVLIAATQIFALGSEATIMNFAGCDFQGNGGVVNLDGEPMLLPAGMDFSCAKGRYQWAQWNGVSYKILKGRKYRAADGEAWQILNYYVDGDKKARESQGGYLKSTMYYFCQPISAPASDVFTDLQSDALDNSTGTNPIGEVGIMIPIDKVMDIGVPAVVPSPIPLPFPDPEPEIITDQEFFANNMLIDAMEESGGRGLAGAITSLDFAWNDAPWETDAGLGRAPKYVKVTLSFSPIHDEPLGLTADGSLRSAAYPVGKTIEALMGERYGLPGRPTRKETSFIARLSEVVSEKKKNLEQSSSTSSATLE